MPSGGPAPPAPPSSGPAPKISTRHPVVGGHGLEEHVHALVADEPADEPDAQLAARRCGRSTGSNRSRPPRGAGPRLGPAVPCGGGSGRPPCCRCRRRPPASRDHRSNHRNGGGYRLSMFWAEVDDEGDAGVHATDAGGGSRPRPGRRAPRACRAGPSPPIRAAATVAVGRRRTDWGGGPGSAPGRRSRPRLGFELHHRAALLPTGGRQPGSGPHHGGGAGARAPATR